MKLGSILGLSLVLSCGFALAEDEMMYNGLYLASGLSEENGVISGWYDAEKTEKKGDVDDPMCYAASAANILAWWQQGSNALPSDAPTKLDDIWNTFKNNNQLHDTGGTFHFAVNWWLSGVYAPSEYNEADKTWSLASESDPMWERYFLQHSDLDSAPAIPVTLPNYKKDGADFCGYYYDQYGLTQQKLSDFIVSIWDYSPPSPPDTPGTDGAASDMSNNAITLDAINSPASIYDIDFAGVLEDSAISLAILDDDTLGHAITLWGVEYDEDGKLTTLWLTDSDDYIHQLFSVAVTLDDKENKIYLGELVDGKYICDAYKGYENVYIGGVYAIDTSESAGWQLIPEPTTATLSLLALAGLAARRRRGSR